MCKRKFKPHPVEKEIVSSSAKRPPVQNFESYLDYRIALKSDKEPIVEPPKQGGIPHGEREKCTLQVYVSQEVAESSLARMNAKGVIERCKICGMLHVKLLTPPERGIYSPSLADRKEPHGKEG